MSDSNQEPDQSPNLEDLSRRLSEARGQPDPAQGGNGPKGGTPMSGLGIALRLSTEFVAAVVVGAGIGWVLDRWFGTWPVLALIFFLLGAAAGMLNVIRAAKEIDAASKGGTD